jgi:hypothetical protein
VERLRTHVLPCSVASTPRPPKVKRLNQQSEHAGDHECCSPYQVEIELGLPKNREAELAIDTHAMSPVTAR